MCVARLVTAQSIAAHLHLVDELLVVHAALDVHCSELRAGSIVLAHRHPRILNGLDNLRAAVVLSVDGRRAGIGRVNGA